MGWISVGLLILSGGCILYRHPPASVISLLWSLRKKGSLQQPQSAKESSPHDDLKREQSRCEESPSIKIEDVQDEGNEVPAGDIPRLATASSLLSSSNSRTKLAPVPSTAPTQSPPALKPPTFSSMPPPPRPSNNAPLRPPPSAASSLRVPVTKTLSTAAFAPSRLTATPAKRSKQVTLAPGHSPLDWAALTSDPNNKLRGDDAPPDRLIRVPPSQLQHQNGRKGKDAWTVYHGKVYNITSYLPFHPGGEPELMRGAGRDAAKLFMEVHPWVNWEAMLGECLVGILVAEGDEKEDRDDGAGELDEMD